MRCKGCRHYEPFPERNKPTCSSIDFGWCESIGQDLFEEGAAWCSGYDDVFVSANFGCIRFEAAKLDRLQKEAQITDA